MPEIIEYRKSTIAEGYSMLSGTAATVVGMVIFVWVAFNFFGLPLLMVILLFVAVAIVGGILIYVAILNLRSPGEFKCRIDDDHIICECPVPAMGDSFTIPIRSIARVEHKKVGEASYTWYIVDVTGHRFPLTSNYGNPVEEFVDAIVERVPDVPVIR